MKQTAVEWLIDNLRNKHGLSIDLYSEFEQAKEIEKEQIVKHSVELTRIIISNPFETSGKTPTELMDNYFKETFKQ
jgi:hypothetical protein